MTTKPKKRRQRLLIDADLVVYRTLSSIEVETDWGNDVWTLHVEESDARSAVLARVKAIRTRVDPKNELQTILCFSGSHNFRLDVLPTYKGNRKNTRKPLCYRAVKDWLLGGEHGQDFLAKSLPNLEGDDVMSLLATQPGYENSVIATDDKDLKQIPGMIYRFKEAAGDRAKGKGREVIKVGKDEADMFFYCQTIAGDVTDGYTGVPGIGWSTAEDLLQKGLMLEPVSKTISRGPRKGQEEIRWERTSSSGPWQTVMSCFEKAGLDEDDALVQARVARMLRWGEYDFKNNEVKLWEPSA